MYNPNYNYRTLEQDHDTRFVLPRGPHHQHLNFIISKHVYKYFKIIYLKKPYIIEFNS